MVDEQTTNFISIASLWEIAIKINIDKLKLDISFSELWKNIQANGFEILPVTFEHLQQLLLLDFHHRDPFDRIIIAQACSEHMPMITKDANFRLYSQAQVLW
ncbi:type II toxin-antitoxin system VapC family toxin [Pedobacter sp. BS3]|uniref:type II toxin-antitoxin system VapC family toxin n=1 Tax=Pedobacter sp. BS3 TaxID=2567937 RepID=UPI0029390E64|nr:type II toxin-antitoxin system VapC family toxin [Pedobacter sp. BS3]